MRSSEHFSEHLKRKPFARRSAFTLVEVLVASSIAGIILASALVFMNFARVSISGIAAQAMISDSASNAVMDMRNRIRVATSTVVDSAGNTLTLGFDDNYQTDSDGDGSAYNDKDHYETFQFTGTNGTNWAGAASNRLIYTPRVGVAGSNVVIPFGVRNLPGQQIFSMPYAGRVVIRFGVVDFAARDRFQSIEIQATGVSMNRTASKNFIAVIP